MLIFKLDDLCVQGLSCQDMTNIAKCTLLFMNRRESIVISSRDTYVMAQTTILTRRRYEYFSMSKFNFSIHRRSIVQHKYHNASD